MNKNIINNISSALLGIMMIIFGLNKFLHFVPVEPPSDPVAQQFMGAMFTSYLYVVVAIAEIIGGLLLLFPSLRFAGWLILTPIVFNITAFHFAHDFIGNGIWILPTLFYAIVGIHYKDRIFSLFTSVKTYNHANS